ncbi:GIY-YIG nuclease family protein [Pseudomonas guariconensis]|uniref:GIY-YIG nuclease family protein n=1 Tax=Pseudomonas guariconensis TaxID=1288410 RepID=UPI003906A9A8
MRARELKCEKLFPVGEPFFEDSEVLRYRLSQYLSQQEEFAKYIAERSDGRPHEKPNPFEMAGLARQAKSFTNIYFIICSSTGLVKIGRADNVKGRLGELQVASPGKLSVLSCFRAPASFENFLHCLFSRNHFRGEWFRLDERLLELAEIAVDENLMGVMRWASSQLGGNRLTS